jgi:hypothetical protein
MKRDYPKKDKKNHCYGSFVPKLVRRFYWKEYRTKERMALEQIKKGKNEDEVILPQQHRHSALWDYW